MSPAGRSSSARRGPGRSRGRRPPRARGPEGLHAAARAAHPGGERFLLTDGAGPAARGRGRRDRRGHARLRVLSVAGDPEPPPASCSCRRSRRAIATTRPSRRPPSAGSTRSCPGRPRARSPRGAANAARSPRASGMPALVPADQAVPTHAATRARAHGHDRRGRGTGARRGHRPSCSTRTPPGRSPRPLPSRMAVTCSWSWGPRAASRAGTVSSC